MISLEHLEQRFRDGDRNATKDWLRVEQLSTPAAEETVCAVEDTTTLQGLIIEALGQISGQLRHCFYMKDVKGLSHQKIAEALHISESAARSYASRGRQAFIKAVAQLRTQQQEEVMQ
jgi:DNA-directed RNA polymerase specialized sigma24 family protein